MGAADACAARLKGSGSLFLAPGPRPNPAQPFVINDIDPRGFVHVLDDVTLDIVLSNLDTITDLVEYLDWKEGLVRDGVLAGCVGEENLVALFLSTKCTGRWAACAERLALNLPDCRSLGRDQQ